MSGRQDMAADAPFKEMAQGAATLVNAVGLHARPSVKLTQIARRFVCDVEIALSPDGPWVDAKSPVMVMRVNAPCGATVHVRSAGAGAGAAADAVLSLIRQGFGEAGRAGGTAHG